MSRPPLFQSFDFLLSLCPSSSLFTAAVKLKKIRKPLMSLSFSCHFHQKNGVPMCSIQLLSNNIFSIPVSMKSLKLCLLMWLHYKKEHSLSGNRKKYALKIQQSQDIMNAEKDEHFSVGTFFLPHDTSLAEKFVLYSIT